MDDVVIAVENVSKTFRLPREKSNTIKSSIVSFWRRKRGYDLQVALQDVSFEVKKGEFFGIVGRNGSGKSTLLKLIAGIYTPSGGHISVNGKLTPFIELGVGFNMELTGRENIFLNGSLLGFSRKEMSAMYEDIVEFAELERFMDQKLKNYSSGMQVRLAFSIATRVQTDILLIDEVLAVGDSAFQQKCFTYFEQLKKNKKTVIFVTHDMSSIERFCDKVLVVDNSKPIGIYKTMEGSAVYVALNKKSEVNNLKSAKKKDRASQLDENLPGKDKVIKSIVLSSPKQKELVNNSNIVIVKTGDPLEICINLKGDYAGIKNYKKLLISISIYDRSDDSFNAGINSGEIKILATSKQVGFVLQKSVFLEGTYEVRVGLFGEAGDGGFELIDYKDDGYFFSAFGAGKNLGDIFLYGKWYSE